jgi:predicted transcriptional regulator
MNIQAEKLDIIQWLAGINDSRIIRQFMLLKKSSENTSTESLSQLEKDAIDKGLSSIEKGNVKLHQEVIDSTRKKYNKLFKSSDE